VGLRNGVGFRFKTFGVRVANGVGVGGGGGG